jgi:hypothetical protein
MSEEEERMARTLRPDEDCVIRISDGRGKTIYRSCLEREAVELICKIEKSDYGVEDISEKEAISRIFNINPSASYEIEILRGGNIVEKFVLKGWEVVKLIYIIVRNFSKGC